jgi:hypothetical protein
LGRLSRKCLTSNANPRLPRIMSKQTSYDGDTWRNPRHKAACQADRWPALRAVGEVPRSNRIRLKDQIKPMLFWRMRPCRASSVGHFKPGSQLCNVGAKEWDGTDPTVWSHLASSCLAVDRGRAVSVTIHSSARIRAHMVPRG